MARGKPHSDEVKAQVLAALMAGQGITETATTYKLPESTVRQWATGTQFAEVRAKKGERLEGLTFGYLEQLLITLTEQAKHVSEKQYVQKQQASEIAVLHGVMADKGFRLLSAIPSARVNPDSAEGEL